jgi:hypothetical protein
MTSPTARRPGTRGRAGLAATVATAVFIIGSLVPSGAAAAGSYPRSMASTGDSITRAATTGILPWTDNPAASWSTGTDARVNSHYLRLLALNPKIQGKHYNDARSGAKMADLAGQMTTVVSQRVGYVTVMGGNDVAPGRRPMTSVSAIRTQFTAALNR